MPKLSFTSGSPVPPEWFTAMQDIQFDDQTGLDGHYAKLTDAAFSTAPGNILANFSTFRDALLVGNGGGLVTSIAAGSFVNDSGLAVTVAATTRTLPQNATSFIWVDNAGTVTTGTVYPTRAMLLAQVTTNATAIVTIVDLRPRFVFLPQSRAINTFGGGSAQDLTYSSNTTLNGKIQCRNLTINAGVAISVTSGYLEVEASGTVTIAGSITATPIVRGGNGFSGTPVAGLIYFAESGNGLGGGGGHSAAASLPYHYSASPFGSGGASGLGILQAGAAATQISQSRGGFGGGSVIIRAGGAISVTGSISCNGSAGTIGSFTGGSGVILLPGAGGGSGGSIQLYSLSSITAPGSLTVAGGNGAPATGLSSPNQLNGGFGGSGGWVVCQAPSVSLVGGSTNVSQGGTGASFGSGTGIAGSVGGSYAAQGQANGTVTTLLSSPN